MSAVVEAYLALGVLFKPDMMMQSFGITQSTSDILYMAAIIGWFCLLATALAALAAKWVDQDRIEGYWVAAVLGLFWLGIGLHLGLGFSRFQHLGLDAAKGFIILTLTIGRLRKEIL